MGRAKGKPGQGARLSQPLTPCFILGRAAGPLAGNAPAVAAEGKAVPWR